MKKETFTMSLKKERNSVKFPGGQNNSNSNNDGEEGANDDNE